MRVGHGFDAHKFGGPGPVVLGGVTIDHEPGLEGTSDADVLLHALGDALLGACALGDLGEMFPGGDDNWVNADSAALLNMIVDRVLGAGYRPAQCDVTIIAESIRVAPHRASMRARIAGILGIDVALVSVKATTTDGMGFTGANEGVAALATVTVESVESVDP